MRARTVLGATLALSLIAACPSPEAPPPVSAPSSAPASPHEGFSRPKPQPPSFEAPEGKRTCYYRLKETTTELLDKTPHARFESTIDYVLLVGGVEVEARVLRARTKARQDGYEASLDSGRSTDRRRVRGGADTLLSTDIAEAFAVLDTPLTWSTKAELTGGERVREKYRASLPPVPRADEGWTAEIDARASDLALTRWLRPGYEEMKPHPFSRYGLRAEGQRARRVRPAHGVEVIEVKEAFVPKGRSNPGPKGEWVHEALALTRELTVSPAGDDPCFERAAESLSLRTRVRTSSGAEAASFDRLRTRLWQMTPSLEPAEE